MARPAATVSDAPAVQAETPKQELGPVFKLAAGPSEYLDERLGIAKLSRPFIRKVFPDHWSFLLGEVALYSFVVLLLTGVFLTIWYTPSMAEVEYDGSYQLLRGLTMSQSYESALHLSFDIRGGLLVRQIHHWAAMLFRPRCWPTASGSSSPVRSASHASSTGCWGWVSWRPA
jgi:ubiquinol-cytochrome c reductase cytochrome b subunit